MSGAIPSFIVSCGSTHIDLVSVIIDAAIIFCVYLVVSLTVNLEFGYTGVPNFGKVLFVSVGGLIAGSLSYRLALYILNLSSTDVIASQALFSTKINQYILTHTYLGAELFLFSLAVGAGIAALIGYLASYPAIRLREDYLGMLLLAAGEFFRIFVAAYYPITGGTQGLLVPDPVYWTISTQGLRDVVVLGVLILAALGVYLYSERVARSPLGRMMRAVRDNEVSSEAIGKDTVGIRRNVLIIASALSGIAGVLFVLWSPSVSPYTFLRTEWTFYPFVIVILGGVANNLGVGIGTAVFVGITTTIDQARTCIISNGISLPVDINAIEPIAIGVLLLVVLFWRPKGLVPEKPSATLKYSRLKEISERAKTAAKQEGISAPEKGLEKREKPSETGEDSG
ncbi:MAG: branched-chain amino acid ABC transporter permease [Nitrososphaerota archaeon]|nr:branched-chain amino acid ABC transporter permease [Nitrososphaerota archaeon]